MLDLIFLRQSYATGKLNIVAVELGISNGTGHSCLFLAVNCFVCQICTQGFGLADQQHFTDGSNIN